MLVDCPYPFISLLKSTIPVTAFLLFLQGLSMAYRSMDKLKKMIESVLLFFSVILILMAGFPVAFTLGGVALIFAGIGLMTGNFDAGYLNALPSRLYGTMTNETLMAVPLFIFMGITLEKAKIAEDLLETMSALFGDFRGGLAISVILVGMLLAASTGIVGATVVTMGLLSLPSMIKRDYAQSLSTGVIAASGTLGQIIPPSIVLVLLGDVLSSAYQRTIKSRNLLSGDHFSWRSLCRFNCPRLNSCCFISFYVVITSFLKPESMPPQAEQSVTKRINLGCLSPFCFLLCF